MPKWARVTLVLNNLRLINSSAVTSIMSNNLTTRKLTCIDALVGFPVLMLQPGIQFDVFFVFLFLQTWVVPYHQLSSPLKVWDDGQLLVKHTRSNRFASTKIGNNHQLHSFLLFRWSAANEHKANDWQTIYHMSNPLGYKYSLDVIHEVYQDLQE